MFFFIAQNDAIPGYGGIVISVTLSFTQVLGYRHLRPRESTKLYNQYMVLALIVIIRAVLEMHAFTQFSLYYY